MKITDNYIFGDIVAGQIPFSDGSETKIRPVLILEKDKEAYLMLRITGNISNKEKYDLHLNTDTTNNLRAESLIKIKKIWNYSKKILTQKIWHLSPEHKREVKSALKSFIDWL